MNPAPFVALSLATLCLLHARGTEAQAIPAAPRAPNTYHSPIPHGQAQAIHAEHDAAPPLIPARIATRLSILDADLAALGQRGGNRWIDGIGATLFGGVAIAIGVLADDVPISPYLYASGAVGIARGILDFALTPNAERLSLEYSHMPTHKVEEVKRRLIFGERALQHLAQRSRLQRLLDGSLSLGVALAALPVLLLPDDIEIDDGATIFVIAAASLSLVTGLIALLLRSEAEKRWTFYDRLRTRLVEERRQELQRASTKVSVMPLPTGVLTSCTVTWQ